MSELRQRKTDPVQTQDKPVTVENLRLWRWQDAVLWRIVVWFMIVSIAMIVNPIRSLYWNVHHPYIGLEHYFKIISEGVCLGSTFTAMIFIVSVYWSRK